MIELGARKPEAIRQIPLEIGYQLQRYQIERVLGESSFGITYLARDLNLDRLVAVREYLPSNIAVREGPVFVHPIRDDLDERYHSGLELFLAEARVLAKIDHPNIVRVLNVFVNHNTAYMVMLYEDAATLTEILKDRGTLSETELTAIMLPILDGLERVHRSGYLHRDINPSNILIRNDNTPVLIDFGSARLGTGEITSDSLSSACTALEQFYEKADQQGPWTDIYGMATTAYYAVAGVAPADALQRSQAVLHGAKDPLIAATQAGGGKYSPGFLRAIDHALNLNPVKRPQTIAVWRRALGGAPVSHVAPGSLDGPTINPALSANEPTLRGHYESADNEPDKPSRWAMVVPLLLGVGLGLAGLAYYVQQNVATDLVEDQQAATAPEELQNLRESEPAIADERTKPVPPASDLAKTQPTQDTAPAAAPTSAPAPAEEKVSDRVNVLLAEARTALDAGRLIEPSTDNAMDRYRAILTLQPGQVDAEIGLESIAKTLLEQARTSIGQARYEESAQLIEKAALVRPGLAEIEIVRNELVAQREDQEKREEQRREDDAMRSKRDQVVDRLVEDARKAMRRLQWTKAEEVLNKAAELAPAAEDVKDLRAQIAARQAQVTKESSDTAPAPAITPQDNARAAGYIAAARRAISNKQWRRAEIDLNKASELSPASDEVAALQLDLAQARLKTAEPSPAPAVEENKAGAPSATVAGTDTKPTGKLEETTVAETPAENREPEVEPRSPEVEREPAIEDQVANVRPGRRAARTVQKEAPDRVVMAEPSSPAAVNEEEPATSASSAGGLTTVSIRRASSNFDIVSPGETIQFSTEYYVGLPPDQTREWAEIQWILKRDGRKLGQEGSDSRKISGGANVATNEFTLPSYMKPGRYTVEHRVRVGDQTATARTYFTVTAAGQ